MQIPTLPSRTLTLSITSALLLAACSGDKPPSNAQGAPAPTAPAVTVVTVQTEAVPMMAELPGRTSPWLIAEVRPQVTGIVKQRNFVEGSEVKAGQVLYQIDPATYQAAYDSAKATLARAEANLYAARIKAERYAELVQIEAVSKQANDEAAAALKQVQADVAGAKAAVDKARVDLDFTRVTAPIAGRIGRSTVTPGALVTANQAAALVTVQKLDPIYVDVTQSSADLLRMRADLAAGKLKRTGSDTVPVQLVLEDGSQYGAEGKLAFSDVTVDQGTGSVMLRAVFPNPKGELLPGMYVRARLSQGVKADAVLVPHGAVSRDPRGNAQVMVVNGEAKVEARTVTADQSQGDKWVVTAGLAAGDRVIVEGLQRVRPGAAVQAQEAGAPTSNANNSTQPAQAKN
ncbi:efflux RND transporter periplasmic adaptor subunit [Azoarcus sp. KH32C]|uniref:efflux RND transporter periplasmic adaptor subunit n=1 Tax=Azoarcus sp. KH32C TaxID=748247 RepID=UPI0002385FD5|nr:efflux RND transporter periplasmic adaptor subunit [Azoarcus sp. KH32C]BAL23999.1 acriflavin resistance protein A [Azoarcus sp. KH32C]